MMHRFVVVTLLQRLYKKQILIKVNNNELLIRYGDS